MIFKETLIKSLSFAFKDSRFPHMCRAPLRFPHLSFLPPVPYPPLRGTFPARVMLLKLATPISNGGLFGTPPGFCTDTCLWQV